jgi:hypothetical protein
MLVPPPGQLAIVLEAERIDPKVTGQDQYRTTGRIAQTPAIDRM